MAARRGEKIDHSTDFHTDRLMLHTLGVGLEQVTQFILNEVPDFAAFETWIIHTAGMPSADSIARINALTHQTALPTSVLAWQTELAAMPDVLSKDDLRHWDEQGFVILHEAVPAQDSAAAAQVIWDTLNAREDDVESWYHGEHANIMVQLFQSPAFDANRRSARIHKAFAQLWQTTDLWVTTDRCGFNVPERPGHSFRGPDLHWDMSLHQPVPFGTQGILYLTDTPPEQGALTLVPGFQHRLNAWMDSLPADADPREQDLHALGSRPIGGKAGDMVIWNQLLPHGSRPNRGTKPRIVQYINMLPSTLPVQEIWR
ncbi:phytanoyl-CoA dioxygenase family protein [Undibacterium sp. CY18W]|uniref:Phytanoyl-CoA dioxygenase family protein n=2 Tax=Undibacterium hunanense TaxID=2762292 RepID=A0ABR6ZNI8_9BURK|nr:phytanoyl-CoA dioxygenase family protein [Undibacterium hunanense]